MCEVSLKNVQEKPYWYLWKYTITSLHCLAQGIIGNVIVSQVISSIISSVKVGQVL